MISDQIFFRPDEMATALRLAERKGMVLIEIIDKRSNNPKPRMFVLDDLGFPNVRRLNDIGMWKRMWVWRVV